MVDVFQFGQLFLGFFLLARIEVQWPGGQREVFPGGKANQIVVLTEGIGSPVATAKPAPALRP